MPTTTIHLLSELENYKIGSLMFPSDYHDSTNYYEIKDIKKKYGFHKRSKVYILTKTFEDDVDYINAPANKENKQRVPTCCPEECEGAEPVDMSMFSNGNTCRQMYHSWYPYGDVMIFGETEEQKKSRVDTQEYEKRCKDIRKELMNKMKTFDEKQLAMVMEKIEEIQG